MPKLSDILIRTSQELDIFDSPLLLSRNDGISDLQRFIKRAMDFICSSIGIVVLSPFFLLVALSIYLTDRVRSLQADPSHRGRKRISDLQISDDDTERGGKTGARLAAEHDDRILPVGHFLRRTRLDELPQLFNIWKVRCRS